MVEKELMNMKFKNEERYINGATIAKFLQSMLNAAHGKAEFYVAYQKDTNTDPAAIYGGVMSCEIEPFSLRGTLSQTITIDYKCKVSSQDAAVHAAVNKTLESILGPVDGSFYVSEKAADGEEARKVEYTFWSNFRYAKPTTTGDVDGGVFPTTYNIKGYMHVVREGGALLSNHVKTYILSGGKRYEVALRRGSHGVVFNVANPIKPGSFTAATEFVSAGYAKSVYILYKDDYICHLLRDLCERTLDDDNPFVNANTGKYEITLVEEYPNMEMSEGLPVYGSVKEIKTTYYIVQATCERESGAYMTFALSLMQREENVTIYDEPETPEDSEEPEIPDSDYGESDGTDDGYTDIPSGGDTEDGDDTGDSGDSGETGGGSSGEGDVYPEYLEVTESVYGGFAVSGNNNCTGSVEIPATIGGTEVTEIADNAFVSMGVTVLYIPSTVRRIGENVIDSSTELVVFGPETEIMASAFSGGTTELTLVYRGTKEEFVVFYSEKGYDWISALPEGCVIGFDHDGNNEVDDGYYLAASFLASE